MKRNNETMANALYQFKQTSHYFEASGSSTSTALLREIDNLASELQAYRYRLAPVDNQPVPPPNWKAVHIGDGIFVETDNPELNCEVG